MARLQSPAFRGLLQACDLQREKFTSLHDREKLNSGYIFLQDEEPMAFNDEEELRRKQVAERAAAQQERLRDA